MALDLDRGNRLELPWLGGKVVELGKKLGVPTPTHSLMYAMLKPYIMGKPAGDGAQPGPHSLADCALRDITENYAACRERHDQEIARGRARARIRRAPFAHARQRA